MQLFRADVEKQSSLSKNVAESAKGIIFGAALAGLYQFFVTIPNLKEVKKEQAAVAADMADRMCHIVGPQKIKDKPGVDLGKQWRYSLRDGSALVVGGDIPCRAQSRDGVAIDYAVGKSDNLSLNK